NYQLRNDRDQQGVFEAFMPPDRHRSMPLPLPTARNNPPTPITEQVRSRLDAKQMTLIRSALAACNTIDLRDRDNDITAMTVDLGGTTTHNLGERLYARVYGTEKQLVISAVV